MLVDDFLRFVDDHFSYLNPYTSLDICKDDAYLIRRRCSSILGEIAPELVKYHHGWADAIHLPSGPAQRIVLSPTGEGSEWSIELCMFPAVTVTQARLFYDQVRRDEFLGLAQLKGWGLKPNLNFAFMGRYLAGAQTRLAVEEYLDYWLARKAQIGRLARGVTGFEMFSQLLSDGLISDDDLPKLHEISTNTQRQWVDLGPGFELRYSWRKPLAYERDKARAFAPEVKQRIQEAMSTWGQELPG
jgi:hypothetical protein